jgi:hypothetical protein
MGSFTRPDVGIVWMLDSAKNLIPVSVKTGTTDYTFTEMKEGKVEAGAELVIGQSSGRTGAASASGPNQGGANRMIRRM